jgi:hypothetical protein
MKKYIGGLTAIIIAFAMVAFTKAPQTSDEVYYWFQTNAAGTTVTEPARSDVASPGDPSGCNLGANFCSLGYTASKTTLNGAGHRVLISGIDASDRDAFSKHN